MEIAPSWAYILTSKSVKREPIWLKFGQRILISFFQIQDVVFFTSIASDFSKPNF